MSATSTESSQTGGETIDSGPHDRPDLAVRPRRHPVRLVSSAVVLVLAGLAVRSVASNDRFGWDVVREFLFDPAIIDGLRSTLLLTFESALIGLVLGGLIAVMRLSPVPVLALPAWLFALFFRGTPLLVQIVFWYNLAALYPTIDLSLPVVGTLYEGSVNELITPMIAGLLALSLNEAAYMSEIIRAGIIGVDKGQVEAAKSIGMRPPRVLRRIILPQAMRTIIPPMGNEIIGLLKGTSLVSVIAVSELLFSAQIIYSQNLEIISLLIVVSIWYLVATTVMSIGQFYLERHYGRGANRNAPRSFRQVLGSSMTRSHAIPPALTRTEGDQS